MKLTLSPGEAKAAGLGDKEVNVNVPMRQGTKPNVIVPVGATVQGVTVGPIRLSLWIKAPGSGAGPAL